MRALLPLVLVIAQPALAQTNPIPGTSLTSCDNGAIVATPDGHTGTVDAEMSGVCMVTYLDGGMGVYSASSLKYEAEAAAEETQGVSMGPYACAAADGTDGFDLTFLDDGFYAGPDGTEGQYSDAGDGGLLFTGGSFDGITATIDAGTVTFTPVGQSKPVTCTLSE